MYEVIPMRDRAIAALITPDPPALGVGDVDIDLPDDARATLFDRSIWPHNAGVGSNLCGEARIGSILCEEVKVTLLVAEASIVKVSR